MKILFFIDSLKSGGKERRLVELIKGLSNYPSIEMEVVLTREIVHYKDIFSTRIRFHYIIRKVGLKKDPTVFYKFFNITKKFKPDIIHVWSNLVAIYAIPSKVLLRIPMINNQITNTSSNNSSLILSHKLTFPFSDRIIANTYSGLRVYNAPKSKSSVVYNGFDFGRIKSLYSEVDVRNSFNIKTKYVVGMVASFSDKKDYYTFIKAAGILLRKRRDITFLCVGSGNSDKFEKMVFQEDYNKILFLGEQNKIESIMNICDIGVLMTNNKKHGEGISNAILEFNAMGIPVIASLGGGNKEIIEHNFSGYLITPKSSEELADKISYLINNKKVLDDFGNRSKQIVIEKFDINKMIKEFISTYNEMLN